MTNENPASRHTAFDTWYAQQPMPQLLARMDPQQAAFNAWQAGLAARQGEKIDAWREGVLMAASVLVSTHDQPTMAADILNELGLRQADCSALDDFDKSNLRKVVDTRPHLELRGLSIDRAHHGNAQEGDKS